MDGKKDLLWIILIFVGFGILWAASGAPTRERDTGGVTLGRNIDLFENQNDTSLKNNSGVEPQPVTEAGIAEVIKDVESELKKLQEEIERIREEKQKSFFSGKISLSRSNADEDYAQEYVRIKLSSSLPNKVTITGMELYSPMTGESVKIGLASVIPKIGAINRETPIEASPGDTLYIHTGYSPTGYSFRTNLCSGYLNELQSFTPRLDKNCPSPDEEAVYLRATNPLSVSCLETLDRLTSCQIPKTYPSGTDNDCILFAQSNLNYNACVANHLADTDFPGNEWYVYLEKNSELWRDDMEIIKLLDQSGKTIDTVSF